MPVSEPTIVCSDVFNKAFVVTGADITHFYEAGKRWVDSCEGNLPRLRCKASLRGSPEHLVSDTAESIMQYSNPRKQQIESISLVMSSADQEKTFEIVFRSQEYPALIQVEVGGQNSEETEKLFRITSAEVADLGQWYSPLACRRWMTRLLSWTWWLFLILSVSIGFISLAGSAYQYHRQRTAIAEFRRQHPGSLLETRKKTNTDDNEPTQKPNSPSPSTGDRSRKVGGSAIGLRESLRLIWQLVSSTEFLLGAGIVIGGVAMERVTRYLFPRSVFEIGNGVVRHQRLKAIRKWLSRVIGTVILLGFIIPSVQRLLQSWTTGNGT